jgi:hypothetical protein
MPPAACKGVFGLQLAGVAKRLASCNALAVCKKEIFVDNTFSGRLVLTWLQLFFEALISFVGTTFVDLQARISSVSCLTPVHKMGPLWSFETARKLHAATPSKHPRMPTRRFIASFLVTSPETVAT